MNVFILLSLHSPTGPILTLSAVEICCRHGTYCLLLCYTNEIRS